MTHPKKLVAVMVCAAACGQPSALPQGHATASAPPVVATAPAVPVAERPIAGSGLGISADGKTLWAIDPGHAALVRVLAGRSSARVTLPLAEPVRTPLPGPAAELALVGERVLVTISEPSLLLVLGAADGVEQARVELPAGAGALAVRADGSQALVVSGEAGKVSAVDLAARAVRWSADVPRGARDVVWSADGQRAHVTHLLAAGPTTLTDLDAAKPTVTPAGGKADRVGGVGALAPDGAALFAHGRWTAGDARPEVELLPTAAAAVRWHSDVLPGGTFVRVLAARPQAGTFLAVTDDAILELTPEGALARRWQLRVDGHACRGARGAAIAPDDSVAYVLCGDGEIRAAAAGGAMARLSTTAPTPADPACADTSELVSDTWRIRKRFLRADRVEKVIRAYACRYPERTELIEVAKTHGGRKVLGLAITPGARIEPDRPTFFINGGHHGDELLAVNFALDAVASLLEDNVAASGPLSELTYVVVPLVNPDGNWHATQEGLFGRKNGRDNNGDGEREHREGVDVNRNYPYRWGTLGENGSSSKAKESWYRGPSAGSEPETQGVMRLVAREKFVASMSFHTGTLALLAPYTIPGVQQPDPDVAWSVAEQMLKEIPEHPEGPVPLKRRLYALDGCDQDWLRHEHGVLAMLWEGGDKWLSLDPVRGKMIASARASWVSLARRAMAGPSVSGRVLDANGQPLVAQVAVEEVKHFEGERWLSRCRDGRFDRVLPAAGDYTLVVTVEGMPPVRHHVSVAAGSRPEVDIVVPVVVARAGTCAAGGGTDSMREEWPL